MRPNATEVLAFYVLATAALTASMLWLFAHRTVKREHSDWELLLGLASMSVLLPALLWVLLIPWLTSWHFLGV